MSKGKLYKQIAEKVNIPFGEDIIVEVLDEAKADFAELLNVRLFLLKYGPPKDSYDLRKLDSLYQRKTIEKIKKWFGADP